MGSEFFIFFFRKILIFNLKEIFILNQIGMFYISFDSSNQEESNGAIFIINRALQLFELKFFFNFGKY